jgi:hypothetical protein
MLAICASASNLSEAATSCGAMSFDSDNIPEVSLYSVTSGLGTPVSSDILGGSKSNFLYVFKATSRRAGVIVVKSGRNRSSDTIGSDNVLLVRREVGSINYCNVPVFPAEGTSVSLKAYIAYHDYGFSDSSDLRNYLQSLRQFHTQYGSIVGNCSSDDKVNRTDSVSSDSALAFDFKSNRSQFSFDEEVVDRGMYSALKVLFSRPALAATSKLSNLRVEIIRYAAHEGVNCIPFEIRNLEVGSFLRINDLESRDRRPPFPRSIETRWGAEAPAN